MKRFLILAVLLSVPGRPSAIGPLAATDDLNFFEWTAVAPIVVSGTSLGSTDGYHEVRVEQVLRGDVIPGATVKVDLRNANQTRSLNADPKRLKFDDGARYLMLLEPGHSRKAQKAGALWLVRGVRGARRVPSEGAPALFEAVRAFIEVQDMKSHAVTWSRFREMLEAPNPILIDTSLAQFQKFRRGDPELTITLRPLLDHPESEIRRETAVLIGQIVERHVDDDLPEGESLRGDLASLARRDEAVDVRVAATEALGRFSGSGTSRVLSEIAADDPDQLVRFAAEKILLARKTTEDPH